ncbi:hypothetical protein VKT23_000282 [Stygiomarasmius scandens]|uniref:Uncharacterized protein n=1 Tax=Marasmiellus scandens TaxID=2682957 RepID=A0ABR1K715_9AGAR
MQVEVILEQLNILWHAFVDSQVSLRQLRRKVNAFATAGKGGPFPDESRRQLCPSQEDLEFDESDSFRQDYTLSDNQDMLRETINYRNYSRLPEDVFPGAFDGINSAVLSYPGDTSMVNGLQVHRTMGESVVSCSGDGTFQAGYHDLSGYVSPNEGMENCNSNNAIQHSSTSFHWTPPGFDGLSSSHYNPLPWRSSQTEVSEAIPPLSEKIIDINRTDYPDHSSECFTSTTGSIDIGHFNFMNMNQSPGTSRSGVEIGGAYVNVFRGTDGVRIWDLNSFHEHSVPHSPAGPGFRGAATALCWISMKDRPEELLAYGTQNGQLVVLRESLTESKLDHKHFEEVFVIQVPNASEITSVTFDADDEALVLCNRGGVVQLYEIIEGDKKRTDHPGIEFRLIFSRCLEGVLAKHVSFVDSESLRRPKDIRVFGLCCGDM